MTVAELIEKLKTFKPEQEVRVYKYIGDTNRAALVLYDRVLSVNTITREERGLPEFVLIGG